MKRLNIIFAMFLLIGCAPRVIITPDKLPDAIIGQPYYAEINISRGSGPISGGGFERQIYPNDSGLEIIFPEINGSAEYNNMAIQGVPKVRSDITVKIKGDMIPIGYNASSEFEKTYTIKVKESE